MYAGGRADLAIDSYREAVRLAPADPRGHSGLENAPLLAVGKTAEAEPPLREAAKLAQDNSNVQYNLGLVLYRRGDQAAARADEFERNTPQPGRSGAAQ